MAVLADLKTARDNIAAKIAEITGAGMKPNYAIDGVSISWADYMKMLLDAQHTLNVQIGTLEPFVFKSQVM